MAPGVANTAEYQLDKVRVKSAGKSKVEHLSGVGFTVSYDTSNNTVTVDVAGGQTLPKGACSRSARQSPVPRAGRSGVATRLQSHREERTSALLDGSPGFSRIAEQARRPPFLSTPKPVTSLVEAVWLL